MSALGDTLAALARVFDARGIGWYVFGAQAVAIRGAPRATQDVDITVEVARDNLTDLLAALRSGGFELRYPEQLDELLAAGAVIPLTHASSMEVDMVVAGSGLEALALQRAERIEVEGTQVPIAHATDLVVMKILAGRGKDLDDVRALLAGGDVNVREARDLLSQLEDALGQSDLVPALDQAVRECGDR